MTGTDPAPTSAALDSAVWPPAACVLIGFYEAAIDERECGKSNSPCRRDATTRIEWVDGTQSVACDEHAAAARMTWQRLIARLSTWTPEATNGT